MELLICFFFFRKIFVVLLIRRNFQRTLIFVSNTKVDLEVYISDALWLSSISTGCESLQFGE